MTYRAPILPRLLPPPSWDRVGAHSSPLRGVLPFTLIRKSVRGGPDSLQHSFLPLAGINPSDKRISSADGGTQATPCVSLASGFSSYPGLLGLFFPLLGVGV